MGHRLPRCEPLSARRSTSIGEWPPVVTQAGDRARSAATSCALARRPVAHRTRPGVVVRATPAGTNCPRAARIPGLSSGPVSSEQRNPARAPLQVRLAGVLVGLQGLLGLGFAVALTVRALTVEGTGLPVWDIVGEAGYFVVIGAALVAVGAGLVVGRRWARTPAIVTQLLLLPVVYYADRPVPPAASRHRGRCVRRRHVPAADQRAVPDMVDGARRTARRTPVRRRALTRPRRTEWPLTGRGGVTRHSVPAAKALSASPSRR